MKKLLLKQAIPNLLVAAISLQVIGQPLASPTDEAKAIEVIRSIIRVDRAATVAQTLQLTEAEAKEFWPLYEKYRAEMDNVGDGLAKLVQSYAFHYPNVPEERARTLLKSLTDLEKRQVTTRARFLKQFGKILPPSKNLRLAQMESRIDLALKLELAAGIPLVPVEGRPEFQATEGVATARGIPGGQRVRTVEVTASVIMINKGARELTLLSPDGFKTTVKAGPEVVNFDQIRVGDRVKVTATEELLVWLAGPGEAVQGEQAAVALAPVGAKPQGIAAETVQVMGTVVAIDSVNHTATLRFEDGTTHTFPVRADVDLSRRKAGERVVFQVTEMIALTIEQP